MLVFTFLLIVFGYAAACDTSKFNNFHLKWYEGPLKTPTEVYVRNGLEEYKNAYKIEINKQNIQQLCERSVRNHNRLYSFRVDSSDLSEIKPGAFENVPSLREVVLTNNKLGLVEEGVFDGLRISILNLAGNEITTVDTGAFDNMHALRMLDLSSNKLPRVDGGWFKNSPNLTYINLENNVITAIPAEAFKNVVGVHTVLNEKVYTDIILSNNLIQYIHPDAFKGLDGLGMLYLDHNSLKTVDEDLFKGLSYLKLLALQFNHLKCLPKNKSNLLMADTTYLDTNPWDCDCAKAIDEYATRKNKKVHIKYAVMVCKLDALKSNIREVLDTTKNNKNA